MVDLARDLLPLTGRVLIKRLTTVTRAAVAFENNDFEKDRPIDCPVLARGSSSENSATAAAAVAAQNRRSDTPL